MKALELELLPEILAIGKLDLGEPLPRWLGPSRFRSATWTDHELSVVGEETLFPADVRREGGWRALRVRGPLPFDAVGILAALAGPLASGGVSIFVISTHDTDYLLVREGDLEAARRLLREAGHRVAST